MSGARVLSRLAAALGPMGPVLAVLLAGFLLVLAISSDPILAYRDLLLANFYSASNFALFVNRLMPLMLIGLGVALSFRAGVFNVGGEGQLYLGAIAATSASLSLPNLPRPSDWQPRLPPASRPARATAGSPARLRCGSRSTRSSAR